jgi:hypothetical protein
MVRYILYCYFSVLDPSFSILNKKPLRFGSWLCSHLQVKLTILRIPGIGINPFYRTQQNRYFHLKTGAEPAPGT